HPTRPYHCPSSDRKNPAHCSTQPRPSGFTTWRRSGIEADVVHAGRAVRAGAVRLQLQRVARVDDQWRHEVVVEITEVLEANDHQRFAAALELQRARVALRVLEHDVGN